ncbi:MAG: AAA family ATPase, partial [Anaerolineales bacterium]|nr:AAA family ATPase [Anaerolineales bacterium]
MAQALYRKWRPLNWDQVVGQGHVVQTLRNSVVAERVAHAYLFAGPRGTGKTTTARLLAKAVNCLDDEVSARPCNQCDHCQAVNQARFLDLIEIDAASNTSVDDVRDLREKINFSPNQGRYKVYIIDEVHML